MRNRFGEGSTTRWKLAVALVAGVLGIFVVIRNHLAMQRDEAARVKAAAPVVRSDTPGRILWPNPAFDPEDKDVAVFTGRAQAADGTPVSGATLRIDRETRLPPRQPSGSDGRFCEKLARSDPALPRDQGEWGKIALIATAPGFGPAWATVARAKEGEVTLTLQRDDVPIAGRLLDATGRPVAGAIVEVERVQDFGLSLDAFLAAEAGARNPAVTAGEGISVRSLPHQDLSVFQGTRIRDARTDAEGRFRIVGVGREHVTHLLVRADGCAQKRIRVATRAGLFRDRGDRSGLQPDRGPNPRETLLAGPSFELKLRPARTITGRAIPEDGRRPVPINVRTGTLDSGPIRAKVVDAAHYRLEGVPTDVDVHVIALPYEDGQEMSGEIPYLPERVTIPGGGAAVMQMVDFQYQRGVFLRGEVRDATTSKGVRGRVDVYWQEADGSFTGPPGGPNDPPVPDGWCAINEAAQFRVAIKPGRCLIFVQLADRAGETIKGGFYPMRNEALGRPEELERIPYEEVPRRAVSFWPHAEFSNAVRSVLIRPGEEPAHLDLNQAWSGALIA